MLTKRFKTDAHVPRSVHKEAGQAFSPQSEAFEPLVSEGG